MSVSLRLAKIFLSLKFLVLWGKVFVYGMYGQCAESWKYQNIKGDVCFILRKRHRQQINEAIKVYSASQKWENAFSATCMRVVVVVCGAIWKIVLEYSLANSRVCVLKEKSKIAKVNVIVDTVSSKLCVTRNGWDCVSVRISFDLFAVGFCGFHTKIWPVQSFSDLAPVFVARSFSQTK